MNNKITKIIITGTVFYFGISGLLLTFLPQEISYFFLNEKPPILVLALQISGSLYLGFGMMNWMIRNSRIGGIYNRPVVFGNFLHFLIGALALINSIEAFSEEQFTCMILITILYSFFALSFGYLLRPIEK